MSEALPCPFCGEKDIECVEGSTYRWWIAMCINCGAQSGEVRVHISENSDERDKKALKEWNTRVTDK